MGVLVVVVRGDTATTIPALKPQNYHIKQENLGKIVKNLQFLSYKYGTIHLRRGGMGVLGSAGTAGGWVFGAGKCRGIAIWVLANARHAGRRKHF